MSDPLLTSLPRLTVGRLRDLNLVYDSILTLYDYCIDLLFHKDELLPPKNAFKRP